MKLVKNVLILQLLIYCPVFVQKCTDVVSNKRYCSEYLLKSEAQRISWDGILFAEI